MNQTHTFVGNVVADPDLRKVSGGTSVVELRVAVDDRYRDRDGNWQNRPTMFWQVQAWRELADAVKAQVKRGAEIIIAGEIRRDEWMDNGERRGRNFIYAQHIGLHLSVRRDNGQPPRPAPAQAAASAPSDPQWDEE